MFFAIDFSIWIYHKNKESYQEEEKFGYKGKEILAIFKGADKEIPNISTSYDKDPDAIYTSRVLTFSNLTRPVNSSVITSTYLNDEGNNEGMRLRLSNNQLKYTC